MSEYSLKTRYYGLPTPAGAYQAVSTPHIDASKRLLLHLLTEDESQVLDLPNLVRWTGLPAPDALSLLFRLQKLALIEGYHLPVRLPKGPLEQVLPNILQGLSSEGKALLADGQGFYITSVGFPHETAEELSVLAAELSGIYARRQSLLLNNLGHRASHWGLIDAAGNSDMGFWYFFVGSNRFTLVLSGLPQLNQSLFTQLIWSITKRYAKD